MNLTRLALSIALGVAPGKQPPTEFRIAAAGRTETDKGVYVFDAESAISVIENAKKWGNKFSMDYEHRALAAQVTGTGEAPAAAWFDLEIRNGELWAVNVRWTQKALSYLTGDPPEYRYFSPVFGLDAEGRVRELINLALTNLPATHAMEPLAASKTSLPPEEKPMRHLLLALSLSETASESDALAAITRLKESHQNFIALTGKSTPSEALGVIQAWKASNDQVQALNSKLAQLESEKRDAEVEELIKAGKADGKLAPAMESWARETGKKDIVVLRTFLSTAPKLVGEVKKEKASPGGDGGEVTLTEDEIKIAKMTRQKPEDVLARKKERLALSRAS